MISIVIPLYNKEQSIVRTLDSVLVQTYKHYEVIIVNDGSTDRSRELVELWICTKQDNRFLLINQPNGGVCSARNRGIQEAKGEYIAFLDGDDLWAPTYLEELAALIADYPEVGIYGIGSCKVLNGNSLPEIDEQPAIRRIVTNPWQENLHFWTGSSSSSSRENLIKVGLFDERMTHGEDLDMWYRLLLLGGGAISTKCLAYYVQDSENRAMNRVMPLEKHIPYYIDKYADARANNADFRKFFDTQMVYRLYPYLFEPQYRKDARRLSRKLDYSQLKWSLHFRMVCPHLYRLYERLKS